MSSTLYTPSPLAVALPPPRAPWKPASVAFCAFFSSLYMLVKLPGLAPFFPTGTKEIILLVVVAGCFGYAIQSWLASGNLGTLRSPAFIACLVATFFIGAHILLGASRDTASLAALQLSLFPLLFLVVGGVQSDLRDGLTWLSVALIATGVLSLGFEFWDSLTGDAYVLKNIDRSRELMDLTFFNYEGLRREAGIFEGGIHLCSHLGLAVMGAVYLVLRKRHRLICMTILPFLGLGIALTLSRLGLVAMLAGLAVLFGAFRSRRLLRVVGAVALVIAGLLFCSAVFPDVLQKYVQRSLSIFTGDTAQEARYDAWDRSLQTMLDFPYGVGIGTAGGKVERESQVLVPESTFLKLGVELGFVAMFAFVGLYLFALRKALIAALQTPFDDQHIERRLDVSFLAALVAATFVNHAFVQAIEYFAYGPISMMVLGMALNLKKEPASPRADAGTTSAVNR